MVILIPHVPNLKGSHVNKKSTILQFKINQVQLNMPVAKLSSRRGIY